jgi:hypothetical protein
MQKLRLFVVVLLPILAVCAVAASNATAAKYTATGVPANSVVPIAEEVPTTGFTLSATGAATITCTKVKALGASATNDTNKAKAAALRFTSCKDETEPKTCSVNTIETKPISITLEDTVGGKTVEVFRPETGTEFVKIILKNNGPESCENVVNLTVRGLVVTSPENNTKLSTRQPLTANVTEASKLLIYANLSASFVGAGELLLASGGAFCLLS